jgi:hypothetical protein
MGDVQGSQNPLQVVMDADTTVTEHLQDYQKEPAECYCCYLTNEAVP